MYQSYYTIWALAVAFVMTMAGTAIAQTPLPPYVVGVERTEKDLFFCKQKETARRLAKALNASMLAQRAEIDGQVQHVYGQEHPASKLLAGTLQSGACAVIPGETTVIPLSLSVDGKFKAGKETVQGTNVIEADVVSSEKIKTIFILTDARLVKR